MYGPHMDTLSQMYIFSAVFAWNALIATYFGLGCSHSIGMLRE